MYSVIATDRDGTVVVIGKTTRPVPQHVLDEITETWGWKINCRAALNIGTEQARIRAREQNRRERGEGHGDGG